MKLTKSEVGHLIYEYDIFDDKIREIIDIIENHCNMEIDLGHYQVISDFNSVVISVGDFKFSASWLYKEDEEIIVELDEMEATKEYKKRKLKEKELAELKRLAKKYYGDEWRRNYEIIFN